MRIKTLLARIAGAVGLWRRGRELDEELQAHLSLLADEHERRGLSRAAAEQAARRDLGGALRIRESYREQRGLPSVSSILKSLRITLRGLSRAPIMAVVVVATVGLGIGATTAMFS